VCVGSGDAGTKLRMICKSHVLYVLVFRSIGAVSLEAEITIELSVDFLGK
jgi:hypothetical protein